MLESGEHAVRGSPAMSLQAEPVFGKRPGLIAHCFCLSTILAASPGSL